MLLADTQGATNLAGSSYETGTTSILAARNSIALKADIKPLPWVELVNLINQAQLTRFGLDVEVPPKNQALTLSEKWEAMDLVSALDPQQPDDYFLFVGNDNDFIARHCVMQGATRDSEFDNDNKLLVYRLRLPCTQKR